MNWMDTVLVGLCGLALVGIVGWMVAVSARLRAIERALQSVVDNTNSLRDIVKLLTSVDDNTSLLGGIRGVFGSRDHKKTR